MVPVVVEARVLFQGRPHMKLTGRCLWASTTTIHARRTIWASGKGTFCTSLTRRKATGGSHNTRITAARDLSLATTLPNTSLWTPKSELNEGFTFYPCRQIIRSWSSHVRADYNCEYCNESSLQAPSCICPILLCVCTYVYFKAIRVTQVSIRTQDCVCRGEAIMYQDHILMHDLSHLAGARYTVVSQFLGWLHNVHTPNSEA